MSQSMYGERTATGGFTAVLRRLGAALLTVALVACAGTPPPGEASYSDGYGAEMFDAGYAYVADRYIEPVSLRALAVSGLAGLHAIDPAIEVRPGRDQILLSYRERRVAALDMPASDRPEAWSRITVDAIAHARKASPLLAEARAEAIFKAVFDGMLAPLDEFSRYDGAESATERRAFREGFGGIGISIRMDEQDAAILSVMESGPAALAGLRAEDRLTHIGGTPIAGWTQRDLVDALRGPEGTSISLTVRREAAPAPLSVRITRRHVVPDTVTLTRAGDVPVFQVTGFNEKTAAQLDQMIRREMTAAGPQPRGLVLDLRSNPGGLLDVAIAVSDLFLDGGVVVQTAGRHPGSRKRFGASVGDVAGHLPLVVLINGNSASASEIVAAALQDHGRAVVVGTNSYGKGTVQSVLTLPNAGEISLTWSRFLAPSGYRLHHLGVLPSICSHGGGEAVSVEAVVTSLRTGDGTLSSRLPAWRATGNVADANRESLRALCPVDGGTPDIDLAIAAALLAEPALYGRIAQAGLTNVAER